MEKKGLRKREKLGSLLCAFTTELRLKRQTDGSLAIGKKTDIDFHEDSQIVNLPFTLPTSFFFFKQ